MPRFAVELEAVIIGGILADCRRTAGDGWRSAAARRRTVTSDDTWSYLRLHSLAGAGLTDAQFLFGVLIPTFGLVDGKLNIEAMSPPPLFMADDDWRLATLGAKLDPGSGLVADETPPYSRYPANVNQVTAFGNPFAPSAFELRWYGLPGIARAPEFVCNSSQISRP